MHPVGGIAADIAPAKVNLTLRVGGKRADGYHNIEILVVFAGESDALRLTLGDAPSLSVEGPFVGQSGPVESNLVINASHVLAREIPGLKSGHFELTKNLPAAAGLGVANAMQSIAKPARKALLEASRGTKPGTSAMYCA